MRFLWLLALAGIASAQSWIPQHSGTTVSLRGVSAVSPQVVWASGAKGTVLRTTDGGATWRSASAPGAADLDFRSIRAISESTAYLLSSGPGEQSRIYKRVEKALAPEGEWHLLLINPDPKGFWDAIAMWDDTHGIVIGDPVNGRFTVYITSDGTTWQQQKGPAAFPEEHLFAASGECIFTRGAREA